jgi:hypothetical protein
MLFYQDPRLPGIREYDLNGFGYGIDTGSDGSFPLQPNLAFSACAGASAWRIDLVPLILQDLEKK